MAKYNLYLDGNNRVHVTGGNTKIGGIYNISLLPSNEPLTLKNGTVLTNIKGTCGGCCDGCKNACYAVNSCIYHHNSVIPAWGDNTILAREDMAEFFHQLDDIFSKNIIGVFRWHVGGEFFSENYMENVYKFCANHPDTKFYVYTKRFEWVEQLDSIKPSNLVVNVSIWHNNYDNPLNYPEFIYDDGNDKEVSALRHCPAVDKDGHETGITCAQCRRCFTAPKGDRIAVYAH